MMTRSEKIYKELSKTYTDEEIVESFVFSDDSLSEEEQKKADKEFRELRLARLKNMTESDVMYGQLLKFKFSWRKK